MTRRVAIVGAGWAGLAAAVEAVRRGHRVTLFEAARTPGGRARSLPLVLPDGREVSVDNGQHILIAAYVETLALMEAVGVDPSSALLRMPLVLQDTRGEGLALPSWPAPWDAFAGILGARGWQARDKLSLLRAAVGWQLSGFRCDPAMTVADLTRGLTPRVRDDVVDPLCVAALNTPAARASAEVFLRVLRDALFGRGHAGWGGSNLLLPRQDLGRLLPQAATAWLAAHGAQARIGARVQQLSRAGEGWALDGEAFDAVVLATPSLEAARLVAESGVGAAAWVAAARSLALEAIATVYAWGGPRLPQPMLALHGGPAQFVFDRGQLGGPQGLLAFVASASLREKEVLQAEVLAQAAALGWDVRPLQTVVEKRATFACVPGLERPPVAVGPGLWACGDYVEGPYPATLEGAVRSGLAVAARLA
ncbi:FAD-dependent oxidoreductase [Ramlibacter sp. USB13]|uniref:FAD-dependent oxidoreductase n=1 Tax=Ramlibacter cellulosilyticus TaxID=2764187 RepID=A0A923SAR2_9BURK|nr:FAD-dependent oxidoreductase [Ramlibacter cellulosilyticus]